MQDDFDQHVEALDYPLLIITATCANGERAGCVVGFATQCSIEPRRFLTGLSEKNRTYRVAETATHLAVHVLDRREKQLAELFGGETGDEVDKFAMCRWHEGPYGVPILSDIDAWFVGRVVERVALGDHLGYI